MIKHSQKKLGGRFFSNREIEKFCLLAHILNFEKYWAPYTFSDGKLYAKEVKVEGKEIVNLFLQIYGHKQLVTDEGKIVDDDMWMQRQLVESLNIWANSDDVYIKVPFNRVVSGTSRMYHQIVLMELENVLIKELNLPLELQLSTTAGESLLQKNVLRWMGKMPLKVLHTMNSDFMRKMSDTDTIVMVADVRRSQDLMTYGESPEKYQENMVKLLKEVREILLGNYAIYDQFTGDGFIAFFNEHVCKTFDKDYYEMMVDSCKRILDFSDKFFQDWARTIRRIPIEEIGLAIGIDSGKVFFRDIDDQFLAIGDACVWATRMCSAGKKGNIILNNIPYQVISGKGKADKCEEVFSETKTGEKFKAFNLKVEEITSDYLRNRGNINNTPNAID